MKTHAQAMVLASFLGDSFALGAHWIYDTKKIASQFGRIDHLLAPASDSYHPRRGKGEFTHYGDQSLLLLQTLADRKGYDPAYFADKWQQFSTEYDGYLDKATKETLANMTAGKNHLLSGSGSSDLGGPARIAPLVYLYQDNLDKLIQAAELETSTTHTAPSVLSGTRFLAQLAYAVLDGDQPVDVVNRLLDEGISDIDLDLKLRRSMETLSHDSTTTLAAFGQHCGITSALPGAVHLILKYASNLREAFIENVMAGGDSAARGMVIGMILGASLGIEAIPKEWLSEMKAYQKIQHYLASLSETVSVPSV